ncbi:MAG: hypothetical protein LBD55_00060 [Treponema sp.]|jgi:hypothetical protein|nr:hypothetical protein [Treponema sp.]
MKKRISGDPFLSIALTLVIGGALSGCVSTYKVSIGITKELKDYYAIYPSLEVDTVAVTQAEADEIKKGGIEDYFAPNSLRDRLAPFTVFFSDENTVPLTLTPGNRLWKEWKQKKPNTLAVIASLPHIPDMPASDPRMIFIPMKKHFLMAKRIYFQVEPQRIVRIPKKPQNPEAADNKK